MKPLLPIKSHTPQWLFTPPTIRLDLTTFPKSQNNDHCELITNIINEYPRSHNLLYGRLQIKLENVLRVLNPEPYCYSNRLRNPASVFTAELNAILACLSHLTHRPPRHNYLLLTDSLSFLQSTRDPKSTNPITQCIHIVLQTLSTIQSSVIFIWIPGHIGHSQHDRGDQAAKEAIRFPKISDPTSTP